MIAPNGGLKMYRYRFLLAGFCFVIGGTLSSHSQATDLFTIYSNNHVQTTINNMNNNARKNAHRKSRKNTRKINKSKGEEYGNTVKKLVRYVNSVEEICAQNTNRSECNDPNYGQALAMLTTVQELCGSAKVRADDRFSDGCYRVRRFVSSR